MSPTAGWRLGPVRSLLPGPNPPRPMQGWLSPSPGLVPRTGLAAFGSRALGRCSFPWTPPSPPQPPRPHLVAAGMDGGSGCTWTGALRPALPFRAGPDPALGTLCLGSRVLWRSHALN